MVRKLARLVLASGAAFFARKKEGRPPFRPLDESWQPEDLD
jgi:hypothetical protein